MPRRAFNRWPRAPIGGSLTLGTDLDPIGAAGRALYGGGHMRSAASNMRGLSGARPRSGVGCGSCYSVRDGTLLAQRAARRTDRIEIERTCGHSADRCSGPAVKRAKPRLHRARDRARYGRRGSELMATRSSTIESMVVSTSALSRSLRCAVQRRVWGVVCHATRVAERTVPNALSSRIMNWSTLCDAGALRCAACEPNDAKVIGAALYAAASHIAESLASTVIRVATSSELGTGSGRIGDALRVGVASGQSEGDVGSPATMH